MAVGKQTTARQLGERLAAALRAEPAAERFWMSVHGDTIEFWVLTTPTDADTERRLYEIGASFFEHVSDACLEFHVRNPIWFRDGDALGAVPARAEEIPLRAVKDDA